MSKHTTHPITSSNNLYFRRVLALAVLAGACEPADDGDEAGQPEAFEGLDGGFEADEDDIEERLYVSSPTIWTTLKIPVCWQALPASQATERSWVRSQIESTWEAALLVDFTGWGLCQIGARGIRIAVIDEGPHTKGLGVQLDGEPAGMVLNFTFNNWSPSCANNREACIRYIAAHEFGHALGFAHEHNRADRPGTCKDPPQGSNGDVTLGSWDLDSIMNYCNPAWNNNGQLSAGDKAGARQFYGSPTFASLRQDAIDLNNGNGKVYFFNGAQYTRYDRALDRADSGYPKPILGNWKGWPASFLGVDAAVRIGTKAYFFHGNQYIRFDIVADQVDQQPKPILGNWAGWPASWTSVDAAADLGKGKIYFFKGSEYIRFDIATNKIDQQPKPVLGNWDGVFSDGFEYALNYGNGKVYFFKGQQYQRFDIATDKVDPGYPLPIVGNWAGVPF